MGRSRSYPSIGLGEAIERARAIFQKSGKAPTTEAAIVDLWGFSGVHGTSGRVLSALRQYGLLEKRSDGLLVLSKRALTIFLEPAESTERKQAVSDAAEAPVIFVEIATAFPEGIPSDEGLVSRLVRDPNWEFNHEAAERLVAVFRETKNLVDAVGRRYPKSADGENAQQSEPLPGVKPKPPISEETRRMPNTGAVAKKDWDLTIPLVEGGQAILRIPIPVTAEDFDLLKGVITANLDAMRKAIVRSPRPPEADQEDDA